MGIITSFILSDDNGIIHNGTRYETVTSPYTGKVWLDRNLGASRVCTALDDSACFGDYYQWGRGYDGHQAYDSATSATLAMDVNAAGDTFITNDSDLHDWIDIGVDNEGSARATNWSKLDGSSVCPKGFRVPTILELKAELLDAGSAQITDDVTAFASFLKLPAANDRRNDDGSISTFVSRGALWSTSVFSSAGERDSQLIEYIQSWGGDAGEAYAGSAYRAYGDGVRCIKSSTNIIAQVPHISSNADVFVNEGNTTVTTLLVTGATDVTYTLLAPDSNAFEINATTGVLSFKVAPDFATQALYDIDVVVTSSTGDSTLQRMTINIVDTTAPTFTSENNATVAENQTSAITLVATDASAITYSISGADSSSFDVNATTGVVTFKVAPDYETQTTYSFVATATDEAGNETTQTVTIHISNVVENAPQLVPPLVVESFTFTSSGDANWTEDTTTYLTAPSAAKSGDINDSQESCMETIVNEAIDLTLLYDSKVSSRWGDYLRFYIDDTQKKYGRDAEWKTSQYNITSGTHTLKWCYTKNSSGTSGEDAAWVDEIRLEERYYLPEDTALGEVATIGIVTQADADIERFSIAGVGAEKFEVTTTGSLRLTEKLDYEMQRAYTLQITAHNAAGNSNTVTLKLFVTDVDDLYITHAFYDDNGTASTTDDRLLLQYTKAVDVASILTPVAENFLLNTTQSIDSASGSTAVYDALLRYYPHTITLADASTLLEQNLSLALNAMTDLAGATTDQTITTIVATTGSSVVKKTGQTTSYNTKGEVPYHQNTIKDDAHYQSGIAPSYSRDDATQIVTDHITGLQWADDDNVSSVTKPWLTSDNYDTCTADTSDPACYDTTGDTAATYCEALRLGGYSDWRLPTVDELFNITDKGRYSPAINVTFENVSTSYYWSSTTFASNTSNAWVVNFRYGRDSNSYKTNSDYVRCVRDGQ